MRIRYYGRQGERTGYGRAAEHYIAALRGAGATVEAVSLATSSFDGDYVDAEAVDAVIVHALPQDCPRILERLTFVTKTGGDSRPEPPVVAYTTWEALTIDHDISLYLQQGFDEVWVPSNAAAQPFRDNPNPGEDHNVHVIPHCMHEDDLSVPFVPARNPRGLFRFTWIGAWNARKNPSGLIRAFVHAFLERCPRPVLVDADALNALALHGSWPARTAATVLTPHPGEMARLEGADTREVLGRRLELATELAGRAAVHVVLKGQRKSRRIELSIRKHDQREERQLLKRYRPSGEGVTLGDVTEWGSADESAAGEPPASDSPTPNA